MHELYDLKDMLCNALKEYSKKSELNTQALDVVDKLAHAIKNIDKIIENYEMENGNSRNDGSYRGRSYRGTYEGSYDDGMRHGSYARGRMNARRDSMGRYSGNADMINELRELMAEAPDDKTRQEFQRFITKIEAM